MICDIKGIRNTELLNRLDQVRFILNVICEKSEFTVLDVIEHQFEPEGFSILYLLSESHISIHTFPERQYFALDIYTCREYDNNDIYNEIYEYLVGIFDAKLEKPTIIDRWF